MDKLDNPVLLEAQDVHKKYEDDREILKGIDLSLHKGEVLVILGPSGCGKSTFLRCLNGLEKIQGGDIKFKDKSFSDKNINWQEIHEKIGMVFQNYELLPHLSVEQNILLGPLKVQKRHKDEVLHQAHSLLKRVGLESKLKAYPKFLSGGQKQRVAIVRALCMNPKIMLFDEITASLDPEMVREVLDVVLELADEGMTMLLVTHEMGLAKAVSDKIVFLDSGKIIESSTPQEFFTNPKSTRAKNFLKTFDFKRKHQHN